MQSHDIDNTSSCTGLDELLELDRPSVSSVQVPDDDRVASAVVDVFEHASVGRTLLPAVGTDVVVYVLCGDGLSSAPCFLAAVHQLTQDAKAVAITVL